MSASEQAGPPTEAERERRDTDFLKRAQERYAEGYRARAATAPPDLVVGTLHDGRPKLKAQPFLSIADKAEGICPREYPAHERERWVAGFHDADRLAQKKGHHALADRDPLRPPRQTRERVAEPLDAFGEADRLSKPDARARWQRYHGAAPAAYRDAGEQE